MTYFFVHFQLNNEKTLVLFGAYACLGKEKLMHFILKELVRNKEEAFAFQVSPDRLKVLSDCVEYQNVFSASASRLVVVPLACVNKKQEDRITCKFV
jgi:hypothetical protein